MAEVFEIDDIPMAAASGNAGGQQSSSSGADNGPKEKGVFSDKHLPSFDFDGYPDVEDDGASSSPRIEDDTWKKYEIQSNDDSGATHLRHDPQLLDKII